jgi:hypothetical protein
MRISMIRRPSPRRLVIALAVAASSAAALPVAWADSSPPGKVLSHYETDTAGNYIDRDVGVSAVEPGTSNSLWLFGDSVWGNGSTVSKFWLGTTAAVGPSTRGQVPTGLTEIPKPPGAIAAPDSREPTQFLSVPEGLLNPGGASCAFGNDSGSVPSSWPTGVVAEPSSSRMLITHTDVCQVSPFDTTIEHFGVVEYTPATNTLSDAATVFSNTAGLPDQQHLTSPIVRGPWYARYVYLFASHCDGYYAGVCTGGNVWLSRVPADAAHWQDPNSYQYWTGSSWSQDYNQAQSILPGATPAGGAISAGDFSAVGKGFVIIEQTDVAGNYRVWQSNSLTSGWTVTHSGTAPCAAVSDNLCRAYNGHPELSTTSNLLMSYYDPANHHLNVTAVPW